GPGGGGRALGGGRWGGRGGGGAGGAGAVCPRTPEDIWARMKAGGGLGGGLGCGADPVGSGGGCLPVSRRVSG
ncbi:hypothetical protein D1122_15920, partial [Cereibacter sphaeroides]